MVHETIQEEIANMDFTWIIHLENNVAVYDQNLLVLMSIKKMFRNEGTLATWCLVINKRFMN